MKLSTVDSRCQIGEHITERKCKWMGNLPEHQYFSKNHKTGHQVFFQRQSNFKNNTEKTS